MKRTWNLAPVFQINQKITENYCPCLYLSVGQVWWLHELWFKRYIQKCTFVSCNNIHHDFTDSVNHGMVKIAKTWISWEWNTIFVLNKKILNLSLRWHILRSYCFVAEVTFKEQYRTVFWLIDHIYLFCFFLICFHVIICQIICHIMFAVVFCSWGGNVNCWENIWIQES